jgi:hypothetical protein
LFVAIAAARIAFVAACPTPLRDTFGHLYWTIPMLGVGAYYTFIRSRPHIAALFNGMGLLLLATTSSGLTSVLVAYVGRGFPLADAGLEAADRMLGFDWAALLRLHDSHPYIDLVLRGAYKMIFGQITIIIVALAFTKQADRLYHFLVAANIALVATCVIAVFFPALGPYEFLHITKADHPHIDLITSDKMTGPILWLRAGALTFPTPEFTVGLISFPSFHSTTAVIYMWATWRTPYLRWAGLTLNTLMLIATPIHGSHYLVDVFAGIAVAVAALAATGWMFARVGHAPRSALAGAEAAA